MRRGAESAVDESKPLGGAGIGSIPTACAGKDEGAQQGERGGVSEAANDNYPGSAGRPKHPLDHLKNLAQRDTARRDAWGSKEPRPPAVIAS